MIQLAIILGAIAATYYVFCRMVGRVLSWVVMKLVKPP
jgi:hypothetical protein